MFKGTLLSLAVAVAAGPAFAETTKVRIDDVYKTIIDQHPYKVEVCKDVKVQQEATPNTGGAIIGGLIGGAIGSQFGKGDGKTAMTGIGAITGTIIGSQNSNQAGSYIDRQCRVETRYEETKRDVYSHSTATFTLDGKTYILNFNR